MSRIPDYIPPAIEMAVCNRVLDVSPYCLMKWMFVHQPSLGIPVDWVQLAAVHYMRCSFKHFWCHRPLPGGRIGHHLEVALLGGEVLYFPLVPDLSKCWQGTL